jgi:cobalt-zinc-cadmium efflux system outer membrane protein
MVSVRKLGLVVIAAWCGGAITTPARAQQAAATAAPAVLTLDDALARAETSSPLLRRARAEREAVAAREVGASQLLPTNPIVAAGAGPRREGPAPDQRGLQYFLHAEQTVEIGGQRGARRAAVSKALRTAELREQTARAETRARVRAVYVGAQLAQAQVEAARQREDLVTKLLEAVKARVAGGASSDVDLQLARLEKGSAARARVDAALAASDAMARLRILIGVPAAQPIVVAAGVALPDVPSAGLAALIARARTQRTELATLSASQDEIDAEITVLRREVIPSPTLFVDLQRDLPGQLFVGGGLALPLPLWRRNQGPLALARAERTRLDEERALLERDVALEVERAFQTEGAQREVMQLLDREVLPAAEAATTLMTEGWRAGKFDLFRLLQTAREASEARRLYLETLGLLWESTIALDRAVGAQ